jgi:hypothetical protein
MPDPVWTELTHDEIVEGLLRGLARQTECMLDGSTPRTKGQSPTALLGANILGAWGEIACSHWYGKPVNLVLKHRSDADLGTKCQVRCRPRHDWDLHVHDIDKDDEWFVLVTGWPPRFAIRGYIQGAEAKRIGWWGDRGTGFAFWVPQDKLRMARNQPRDSS